MDIDRFNRQIDHSLDKKNKQELRRGDGGETMCDNAIDHILPLIGGGKIIILTHGT